jgi:hypothetical protein
VFAEDNKEITVDTSAQMASKANVEHCNPKLQLGKGWLSEADARNKADRELKDEYRNQMMWKYGSLIQYLLCCSSLKFFVLS